MCKSHHKQKILPFIQLDSIIGHTFCVDQVFIAVFLNMQNVHVAFTVLKASDLKSQFRLEISAYLYITETPYRQMSPPV